MIALNLPETFLEVLDKMYDNHKPPRLQSQSRTSADHSFRRIQKRKKKNNDDNKMNFSSMKLFDRFRRIVMRFIFSVPVSGSGQTRRSCEIADPPKTSCSSSSCNYYYSSNSHYSEAVADCIEFFNKSSSSR